MDPSRNAPGPALMSGFSVSAPPATVVEAEGGVSVNVNAGDPRTTAATYLGDGLRCLSFYVNWSDHETADNVWNTTLEDTVRSYLQDAITNGYRLTFRIRCGALSPAHLYGTLGVRRVVTIETDQGSNAAFSIPDPANSTYRNRYERMMTRWAALLNETYAGQQYWQAVVMIPVAGPCTVGTEWSIGIGGANATLHGTTTPTTAAISGLTTAIPLTANATTLATAGWTTGAAALLKLGTGTVARRRFWDDCTRSPVPSPGWGWNRLGHLWTLNGAAANYIATGTALKMSMPTLTSRTSRPAIFPTDAKLKDGNADYLGKFSLNAVGVISTFNIGLEARIQDSTLNDCYRGRIQRTNSTGSITVEIQRIAGGSSTSLGTATAQTPAIAAATDYYVRMQVAANGANVDIKVRYWAASATEPTTWNLSLTDSAPGVLTNAGGYGLYANQGATVDAQSDPSWKEYRVGDPSGTEFVLVSGISGNTATAIARGWSGSHPVPHATSETVSFASAGTTTLGTAFEGQSGPLDRREVNINAWRELYPPQAGEGDTGSGSNGPETRRAVWLAAWRDWCTPAHMTIFRSEIPQSVAVSGLWADGQVQAAAFVAASSLATYGHRLWIGYTNIDTTDGWPSGSLSAVIYDAFLRGFTTWGQNNGSLANGQDVVTAFEDFLFYTPDDVGIFEVASSRLTASETTTGNYRGWTGGAGKTMKQYLLTDSASLNHRLGSSSISNFSAFGTAWFHRRRRMGGP